MTEPTPTEEQVMEALSWAEMGVSSGPDPIYPSPKVKILAQALRREQESVRKLKAQSDITSQSRRENE